MNTIEEDKNMEQNEVKKLSVVRDVILIIVGVLLIIDHLLVLLEII